MRNALILLVVVALLIVTAGAVNHSVAFDVDWVGGTWRAVSLFWVAAAVALVSILAGLAAALLARRGAVRAQRKLEHELDVTYRRVRDLEAAAPAAAVAPAGAASAPAASAPGAAAVTAQTLAPGAPPVAETSVTVVAAHGSARVTQVLPVPTEAETGDSVGSAAPDEPGATAADAAGGGAASPD